MCKGICQRKDGLYLARFVDKAGKRHDKCFRKLPEARNWLEEARVLDRQGGQSAEPNEESFASPDMTVDAWFEFWIENIIGDLAPNTCRNYCERYVNNVQSVIGKMLLRDV
ncbi:hypothetical protein D1646_04475 [Pseudoflavonifractor sp. 60]|nr:hypothetical protein [Pseudoflavonifractor sp. 60]